MKGPKQVLVKLGPGTVLGDTSVIPSMKAATADVLADDDSVELEAISINILFGLFRSNPGLSMRFYRQMARKLAANLRSLHSKKATIPTDDDDLSDSEERDEKVASERKPHNSKGEEIDIETLELLRKFDLGLSENLIMTVDCTLKGLLKKVGRIHVFSNYLCFESNVFGSSNKDVFPYWDISELTVDNKGVKVTYHKRKSHYINIKNLDAFKAMVIPLWQEGLQNPPIQTQKSTKKKNNKLKRGTTQQLREKSEAVTMLPEDWDLLTGGAKLVHFQKGEHIIKEGMEHLRIYQIALGEATITKKTENGTINLGKLGPGALFGEMTFLEKGEATASIIAEGTCSVYIIEGYFINILFVDYPELAGRFYSYLATILAQRLSDREVAIQKEYAEAKVRRRAMRKERQAKLAGKQ